MWTVHMFILHVVVPAMWFSRMIACGSNTCELSTCEGGREGAREGGKEPQLKCILLTLSRSVLADPIHCKRLGASSVALRLRLDRSITRPTTRVWPTWTEWQHWRPDCFISTHQFTRLNKLSSTCAKRYGTDLLTWLSSHSYRNASSDGGHTTGSGHVEGCVT